MIVLSGIEVTFNRDTPLTNQVLRGVGLNIPTGQFVTVIGSNGAGKSTVLNAIAGTVRPDSGSVLIDDIDVTNWETHTRAKLMSRVFQDPKMGTCEDLTILENFAVARGRTSRRGLWPAIGPTLRKEIGERLKVLDLGLETRLDDKVGLLSGGQRQAVSLLMGTTGQTRVLLLDEHTAALDPKTAEFVLSLTTRVVAELGLTTLMVTHSMAQALHYGDRTIMLHRGRVIFDVAGSERAKVQVTDLLALFKDQGEDLADDSLLLN
ncbi:MAG: ABC transporter ATP-binding protein [Pseudorhodoplanes sp.]